MAYKKLLNSASCTADYRFNAYRRLSSLEGASNVALISASTALIVVSFIVALFEESLGTNQKLITIGQNCLPIVMLALSIMVSGAKYGSRSEKMHDCAQALNHFKKILNFKLEDPSFAPSSKDFKKEAKKYAEIISKHENHNDIDRSIEEIKKLQLCFILKIFKSPLIWIMERGLLFYFYASITLTSAAWIMLALYFAI